MDDKNESTDLDSEFNSLIESSCRDLTLGLFDAALQSAVQASNTASTPRERASAAVVRIQCLHEVHCSKEALKLAENAISNPAHTMLTHDLVLTSASLALHNDQIRLAERMLTSWLNMRVTDADYPVDSAKDIALIRMLVLRVVEPLHGRERGAEVLERTRILLSEEDYLQLRGELVDDDAGIVEINSPERQASSAISATNALSAQRQHVERMVQRLGERIRRWMCGDSGGEVDRRYAVGVAIGAVFIWLLARPRGRNPSLLRVLTASLLEMLNIAFGTSFGRRAITHIY